MIGLLGGLLGILLGIGVGNLVAQQLDAPFVLPWGWVFVALALGVFIGDFTSIVSD